MQVTNFSYTYTYFYAICFYSESTINHVPTKRRFQNISDMADSWLYTNLAAELAWVSDSVYIHVRSCIRTYIITLQHNMVIGFKFPVYLHLHSNTACTLSGGHIHIPCSLSVAGRQPWGHTSAAHPQDR